MPSEKEKLEIEKRTYQITSQNKDVLGYETVKRSIDMIQTAQLPNISDITSKAINPNRIIKIARKDLLQLFPRLNTEILFATPSDIQYIQMQDMMNHYPRTQILKKLNDCTRTVDIFDVPLFYTQNKNRYASSGFCNYYMDDNAYLSQLPLIASFVDLQGPSDYITEIMYEHELGHLLVRRFRGIIEDYYHEEVLQIFMEQVLALECDSTENLSRKMQTHRVFYHQDAIKIINANQDDIREINHCHLISGLIANCIFSRYYNETMLGKKYILSEVQRILNGEKTLKQFLEEQGIDLMNSEVVTATEQSIQRCLIKPSK